MGISLSLNKFKNAIACFELETSYSVILCHGADNLLVAKVLGLHKRLKYRIINCDGKKYLIDLTNNWLTYVLPMLNWYIPKKCTEISDEEIDELGLYRDKNDNNGLPFWRTIGISIICSLVINYIAHYFDINISDFLNTVICIVYAILLIAFHIYLYNKKKIKHINIARKNTKIIVIPKIKFQLLMITCYCMFGLFTFICLDMLIVYHIRNIILYICYFYMLYMFSIINMLCIPDQNVYVKLLK